jgi:hypothetical protein
VLFSLFLGFSAAIAESEKICLLQRAGLVSLSLAGEEFPIGIYRFPGN